MTDVREIIGKAAHESFSRQDINGYLNANVDCHIVADAILTALREAGVEMVWWRPIEEAPRTIPSPGANITLGKPEIIVGWAGSDHAVMAYWEPARDDNGGWDQSGLGQWRSIDSRVMINTPTRFMPLPSPPSTGDEQ